MSICAVEGRLQTTPVQKSGQLPPEYKIQGAAILGNKYNEINLHDAPKQPGNSQVMGANG